MSSTNICFGFVDLKGKVTVAGGRTKVGVPAHSMPSTHSQIAPSASGPTLRETESS